MIGIALAITTPPQLTAAEKPGNTDIISNHFIGDTLAQIPLTTTVTLVNSIFAAGSAGNPLTSDSYQMQATFGELALPYNQTTISSLNYQHQPGFLAGTSGVHTLGRIFLPISYRNFAYYFIGPWEVELNNDYTQANGPLIFNRDYYGYPNDERDWFSFNLPSPGQVTIDLTNMVGSGVQLQLFYQNIGNRVGYDPVPPYQIVYNGQPGLYYVFIYTASGFNNTIPYTLRVSFP